ncbi:MAG TPA: carbon-nitrogen hydrolase family protein [Armatimonadota bacterium]|nr:carbon-nitrogen hydrolase family protein [Armatimonadota bacterium]HOS42057.1 carbon-nitrogen hydrolase family protein [Armatimonadota bacterium]
MPELTIAAIAVATVEGMVAENYRRGIRLAEIALDARPDILLLPETFAAGYCAHDLRPYGEERETSPYLAEFRRISGEGDCLVAVGYLESVPGGVKNAVALYDRGAFIGQHVKSSLWPDDARPYRDERVLLVPGDGVEVFDSRFGRFAVLICYENMLAASWDAVAGRVDFALSPYNCQGDPAQNNVRAAQRLGLPSAWADRTGTVYAGDRWNPNPGTAGLVDGRGHVIAKSAPGVETIVVGHLPI